MVREIDKGLLFCDHPKGNFGRGSVDLTNQRPS